jgi:hypothetical protein
VCSLEEVEVDDCLNGVIELPHMRYGSSKPTGVWITFLTCHLAKVTKNMCPSHTWGNQGSRSGSTTSNSPEQDSNIILSLSAIKPLAILGSFRGLIGKEYRPCHPISQQVPS